MSKTSEFQINVLEIKHESKKFCYSQNEIGFPTHQLRIQKAGLDSKVYNFQGHGYFTNYYSKLVVLEQFCSVVNIQTHHKFITATVW